jgi:hypothetical protein
MTGQIADHFAQRKVVATDEFLEGTTSPLIITRVEAAEPNVVGLQALALAAMAIHASARIS